ncbi:T9SS type A sorting domain-containing protein [Aureisphaera sp. CAU 1614]|uniref:T9SS type A sorting domain-containing protein n=1 Tax=Halomarinibacterium sedimenti TaxID=2857106 RepID=A0A9X1FMY6_9FLAO|nr:T9SS type A sorting domain-containing protein [Halomarinibacterium sedimenti]MBW2937464.1 T9SS type A sorting domain-containing protein [Halomarinibacterium sedimenti]
MFYNLLEFPEANPQNRELILGEILNEYTPDIFMICELQSGFGADLILNDALNTNENLYKRAMFVPNQSGGANLQQMLYYRKDKFLLEAEEVIQTNIRDINHYTLKLSTEDILTNPVLIEIFVSHLKSSQGGANEQLRLEMVQEFTNRLETLDPNTFVIFAGDFNLYSSTEPAYIELLDPTNAIVMADPIDTPGAWSTNINFQDIHTQSTRVSSGPFGAGAGGGLDDRFDFILVSENMLSNPTLRYIPDTYKAFGNNGNCFDLSINDSNCSGFYSETLRENLYNMSDHLPIVMDLETNEEIVILNTPALAKKNNIYLENTIVSEKLKIVIPNATPIQFWIVNSMGQIISEFNSEGGENLEWDVSYLPTGLYFLKFNAQNNTPIKFIKQ